MKRRWTLLRRTVQAAVAVFYLLLPWLNRWGFRGVAGNLASLKLGPVDLVEPASGVSAALAAGRITGVLLVGLAPVLGLALALGPVFCSWVCPWGFLSEGLDWLKVRVFRIHRSWSAEGFRRLLPLRLGVVVLFLVFSWALASPLIALFAPPRLLTALPQEVFYLPIRPWFTGGLLLLWLLLELLLPRRLVCRALCPVGAFWSFLRTPWTLRIKYEAPRCVDPKVAPCHLHCPWGIDPRTMGPFDGCTNCFRCVEGCPSSALVVEWKRLGRRLPTRKLRG